MNYVGVDIAKENHYAAILSADGAVVKKPFSFTNTAEGFSVLKDAITVFDKEELLIGMESTAHYGDNLLSWLFGQGYHVCVINPVQTAALRKTGIRKTKTDKTDALLVAKSLIVNKHRLYSERDNEISELRTLCRFYRNVMQSKSRLKTQLVAYVDVSFPEFATFFAGGIHLKTSYALLKQYSSPNDIAALHLTTLTNLLKKSSQGRFSKPEAIALKALAKSSVGVNNSSMSVQIAQTIEHIELLEKQLADLKAHIEKIMLRLDSPILTVPGIGYLLGGSILGEIGDISRFSKPAKLLAYAGLDPIVSQSGKFKATNTRMSKRGSALLRYALMEAAFGLTRHSSTFADYYSKKRNQGLSHFSAIGHTAHKLVRVLFKILSTNTTFDLA
jgi:transposase